MHFKHWCCEAKYRKPTVGSPDFTKRRFIGLESKQQQGEAQFRAKCEKEKVG